MLTLIHSTNSKTRIQKRLYIKTFWRPPFENAYTFNSFEDRPSKTCVHATMLKKDLQNMYTFNDYEDQLSKPLIHATCLKTNLWKNMSIQQCWRSTFKKACRLNNCADRHSKTCVHSTVLKTDLDNRLYIQQLRGPPFNSIKGCRPSWEIHFTS